MTYGVVKCICCQEVGTGGEADAGWSQGPMGSVTGLLQHRLCVLQLCSPPMDDCPRQVWPAAKRPLHGCRMPCTVNHLTRA